MTNRKQQLQSRVSASDSERVRRAGVRIVLLAGLAMSEACTIRMGRHNPSLLLNNLFVVWVALPYLGIWRLSCRRRSAGDWALLALVGLSVAAYATAVFAHPALKPAFPFLATPLAMWLVLAILGWFGRERS